MKCIKCSNTQVFKCENCKSMFCIEHAELHLKSNKIHSVYFNEDSSRLEFKAKISARIKKLIQLNTRGNKETEAKLKSLMEIEDKVSQELHATSFPSLSIKAFFSYENWSNIKSLLKDSNELSPQINNSTNTIPDEIQKSFVEVLEEVKHIDSETLGSYEEIKKLHENSVRGESKMKLKLNEKCEMSKSRKLILKFDKKDPLKFSKTMHLNQREKNIQEVGDSNLDKFNASGITCKRKKLSQYNLKEYNKYFIESDLISTEIRFSYDHRYAFVCKFYQGKSN